MTSVTGIEAAIIRSLCRKLELWKFCLFQFAEDTFTAPMGKHVLHLRRLLLWLRLEVYFRNYGARISILEQLIAGLEWRGVQEICWHRGLRFEC